ncbi:putative membrane protein YeaQ/YmgE (transglycosylase-associated protein family) [Motilibacter peucedani]|uniref:Putative membrane protein YeaQ/YmgE (Transglycosylase-associated protein family) n=1 Tax=Motilibacter peucedani TaxID=598650 RepID=A0A420XP96_9ACTN|nr:putative membrane protein YeaQ/YmgE (transglycosylase-associated protein family) [Motilibacter peucedani]
MIGALIVFLVVGLVAGFLARAIVPGRDPMGVVGTLVLGLVGSFIGGFLGYVIFGKDLDEGAFQPSGLIGSVIGAVIALLVYRAANGRGRARI